MEEGGIYIHIPFCRNKCLYCDFYSGGSRIADWNKYTKALEEEFNLRQSEMDFNPVTLYLGGGTPSLIPSGYLNGLVKFLNERVRNNYWKEFTLELNPEDVTSDKCRDWKKIGINRISLGLQTLDDNILKNIGRKHISKQGLEALAILGQHFDNVSVDLMFGLPGQTPEIYEKTISQILKLNPTHISSYSLMLEPGTALTHLNEKKKIKLPSEHDWLKMFDITNNKLAENGYHRYEISNYSLNGFESIHNTNYWLGKPYMGLGPGAHSYDGKSIRKANPKDIKGYLSYFLSSTKNIIHFYEEENLSQNDLCEEMIMTRMRTKKGLDLELFKEKFGDIKKEKLLQQSNKYLQSGLLKESSGYLFFTEKGWLIFDTILSDII